MPLSNLRRYVNIFDLTGWLRNGYSVFSHSFKMKRDSFPNLGLNFDDCASSCNAARKIWHVS